MATGKFSLSVAAIALMTAFAAPGELPFITSADAAGLADAQEHEGRRGGGPDGRGQAQHAAAQQPAQRPVQWMSQREAMQRMEARQESQERPQRPAAREPQRRPEGRPERGQQWQGRGDADRRAQFQQRREQAQRGQGPQGRQPGFQDRPDRREWQNRPQHQPGFQGRPDRRQAQYRPQGRQPAHWQNRPQGRPPAHWQNRPHHARPNYRYRHYDVRYSRSNAVRAPAVYHNHHYVNRYGRRNVRWTPPVRIVHHHVNYSGWTYSPRYHSNYARSNFYYTDSVCRSSGGNVAAGALVGALLGVAVSDGDAGALLAGGLIGGGLGAALSNCDRGQYHYATHYAFNTGNPYYWHNPYSGVRGVVHARDFHNWNNQRCRWGDAEIFLPNGEVAYDQVRMCQDQYGYWQVARTQ